MSQHPLEAVIAEVEARIASFERYLAALSWWQFSKKRNCRETLESYRAHLRGLEIDVELEEKFGMKRDSQPLSPEVVDILASPASLDS